MIMSKQFLVAIALLAVSAISSVSIRVPRTTPGENEKRDSSSCTGGKFD